MSTTMTTTGDPGRSRTATALLRRWLGRALLLIAFTLPVGWLVYWIRFSPIPVAAQRVERGTIVAEVFGTGTLEPHYKAVISPEIGGRIREALVDQGDQVKAGQILVQLDDDELTQQVAISQAELEVAQAAQLRAQSNRERARAVEARARRDESRVRTLFSRSISSQEELDRVVESQAIAAAELSSAEAATTESDKQILTAQAKLAYQRALLANAQIRAPADGLVVERQRDAGEVVVPGTPLMTMILTEELWIRAWVDETEMAKLRVGQPAQILFRSESGRLFRGSVARLGRQADRETREFIVDVAVLELPENWSVGQRADVYIETARSPNALKVPNAFVMPGSPQSGVHVAVHGKVAWRPVRLGLHGRDTVQITSGLEPGSTLIRPLDPKGKLTVGRRVVLP